MRGHALAETKLEPRLEALAKSRARIPDHASRHAWDVAAPGATCREADHQEARDLAAVPSVPTLNEIGRSVNNLENVDGQAAIV